MLHVCNNTYTKMNPSTVKWAQWDKTQSRELLVCSYVCALHCAQLLYTILHRTDLIIFPLTLQTITTAPMMSIWGKGGDNSAVFRFFFGPGDLDIWTRARFLYRAPNAKFHHATFNRSEVIMRTNWQTNRRCWKHPPRFATLCYAGG